MRLACLSRKMYGVSTGNIGGEADKVQVVLGLGRALCKGVKGWACVVCGDYRIGGMMGLAWEYPHGMAFGLLLYSGAVGGPAYCLLHQPRFPFHHMIKGFSTTLVTKQRFLYTNKYTLHRCDPHASPWPLNPRKAIVMSEAG